MRRAGCYADYLLTHGLQGFAGGGFRAGAGAVNALNVVPQPAIAIDRLAQSSKPMLPPKLRSIETSGGGGFTIAGTQGPAIS